MPALHFLSTARTRHKKGRRRRGGGGGVLPYKEVAPSGGVRESRLCEWATQSIKVGEEPPTGRQTWCKETL